MMARVKMCLCLVVAGLALAGCASGISAEVTRFHRFTGPPMGSFVVAAAPDQQGGLEFSSQASLISAQMQQLGFTPAAGDAAPDYVVRFTVTQSQFRMGQEENPVNLGVGVGGGSRGTSVGVGLGINLGSRDPDTGYIDRLRVTMDRGTEKTRIFEGEAKITSRDPSLPAVMPYLAKAVFTDFPGKSGKTENIRLK